MYMGITRVSNLAITFGIMVGIWKLQNQLKYFGYLFHNRRYEFNLSKYILAGPHLLGDFFRTDIWSPCARCRYVCMYLVGGLTKLPAGWPTRVARWFIFIPKMPIMVYLGRPVEWKSLVFFMTIWYLFWYFYCHLSFLWPFWYIFPISVCKIWQPCDQRSCRNTHTCIGLPGYLCTYV
jgi:hypothetical protein